MNLPTGENIWVLVSEVGLAALILGFLFFRKRDGATARNQALQRVELKLSGDLTPSEIRLQVNRPAQLLIYRFETEPADELFEVEGLEIYELLPALHTTIIAFEPDKRGSFPMVLAGEKRAGVIIVE